MQPDILSLHRFYQSPLGVAAGQILGDRLVSMLAPTMTMDGELVVGVGFALPYLDRLAALGADTYAFMPAGQGVSHWPAFYQSRTALVDHNHLPIADSAIDHILLVHALEHASGPKGILREVWRVLAPGGKVVIIVPNRRRTWSALETTPFGSGRPYSKSQLAALMNDQMLPIDHWETALMLPPFQWRGAAKFMSFSERVIAPMGKNLGGALIVCARKQIYGAIPGTKRQPSRIPAIINS